ncbi:uncharacterized protein LOC117167217 isoform X3 [Belonocnema kinseyi]|uniref:uncharacterized protein LOC117167217 isoform X3 n=1 Tax=Belonocnema kinseyi TaxID=2817044 RepID=UPI00143D0AEB|nr:uncharacterized protein LOC117167217 isoform X3 [Belonocnema kinseyi]XP_033207874.1 uncharacterized protein LOC117167217 isoform X3 [Belonocnema kinseyi]XP_033207875.1 uncharacterized protein LOC117167217 isoform X3 [Belonocnema kinseyi]XP_033207876.1 uncharacterized protein LOC117167217 isoform X3 [Belonocnema kinseyi]XP_033207877.1 uncharacterized protein LOC117167217 isoform X3 [Belonocnema kinseyi]
MRTTISCHILFSEESEKLALFRHVCGEKLKGIYRAKYKTMDARPKTLQSTLEDLDVYFLNYKEKTDYSVLRTVHQFVD